MESTLPMRLRAPSVSSAMPVVASPNRVRRRSRPPPGTFLDSHEEVPAVSKHGLSACPSGG
ncbi:hypothetical protein [Streptomyces sp. enrichment culture]|uniref:hypothetical protein n=1 Tax=Streptomyces sp. enrichment culture TaxID=1795815 RepID=UPI003F57DB52